jgi:hypothetical protein
LRLIPPQPPGSVQKIFKRPLEIAKIEKNISAARRRALRHARAGVSFILV